MYDANLINYLAQEGISESSLRDGKKVLLVDTGFKGSVAQVVRENFPADLRKNIHGHLLFSNNPSFPFSTIFQQSLSQHREIFSFEGHEFTTFLESLPRYTDKSTEFHLLNGRWTPMSSTELPRLDEKTPVDREKAQMYRESLVHYVEIPEAQRLFTERRATYRKLISLRNKPDELKAELIALLNKNSPIKFNEDLSALLQQSERRNVSTRYFKALVRDFLMSQRINGANLLLPSEDELGIGDLSDGPFSKSDILKQYPQWEHLIESPDTTIPILLEKGDFITLINAVNALENVKFLQSIVDSLEKIEDPKPMHLTLVRLLVMKGSEEVARDIAHKLLSKPKWKYPELAAGLISYGCGVSFLIEFALSKPHWNDQPELVEDIIKQGRNDLFVERFILNQPHWRNSLDLRAIYGEAKPSAELFRKALVSSLSSRQLDFPNASSNDCRGLLKILSISK